MTIQAGACGQCVYWELVMKRGDESLQDEGLCRRNAPSAVPSPHISSEFGEDHSGVLGLLAAWPRTYGESDWCGEFRCVSHLAGRALKTDEEARP